MSRIGVAPTRAKPSIYRAAEVTVGVITHVPSREGYFVHRLEILDLCIKSILRTTPRPFDLLVFDNGSCPEVVEYLRRAHENGDIGFLVLSENIGKMAALQLMVRLAPGELIAYSDDDILYEPGWLEAHRLILAAFPTAGVVTGWPLKATFRQKAHAEDIADHEGLHLETVKEIPDAWEIDFAASTGRDPSAHLESVADVKEILATREGVSAFLSASHFQFVARKKVLEEVLPEELSTWYVAKDESMLDAGLDDAGYLRLSTQQRYVRHMGNVLSDEFRRLSEEWKLEGSMADVPPQGFLEKIARTSRGRFWLSRLYNRLFWALSHTAKTGIARNKDAP